MRTLSMVVISLALGQIAAPPAQAQQRYTAGELLQRGEWAYKKNCVTMSRFYFALLQRFPASVGAGERARLNQRIHDCEYGSTESNVGSVGENLTQPPSPREVACQGYADITLEQVNALRSGGCNAPTGNRWSPNYDIHYSWCAAVSAGQVRAELAARQQVLDQCLFKW